MGGKHCRGLDLVCINGMEVQVFRDDRTNESGLNAAGVPVVYAIYTII